MKILPYKDKKITLDICGMLTKLDYIKSKKTNNKPIMLYIAQQIHGSNSDDVRCI